MPTIRVIIPQHLRTLSGADREIQLEVAEPICVNTILDAVEARYPMLRGTIRDHTTHQRRPFLRFFACEEDFSLDPPTTPLPGKIATGEEPFFIIGSIAGG